MRGGGVEVSLDGERSSMWPDFPDTVRTGQEPARCSEASPKRSSWTPIRSIESYELPETKTAMAVCCSAWFGGLDACQRH
jgi:hypothetical protein